MIFFVIFVNLLLTLLNIYLVIKIRQLRQIIASITSDLVNYEASVKLILVNITQILNQQQVNIKHVRQQYQILQLRWQKIRQVIVIISWIYKIRFKKI